MLIAELQNLKLQDDVIVALMTKINNFEKADNFSSFLASHSNLTPKDLISYAKLV
jgi:hypothetical protein